MEELIIIMTEWTEEETNYIINKIEKKEKLNNFELSYIYFFMKYVEKRKNEDNNTRTN